MSDIEFEILFQKVFGNIFILSTIFKHIHKTEWIKYDHHLQIHPKNRIKFKNIHSLEWMIKNKQYPLIKDKLLHNDYIEITTDSIKSLFQQFQQQQDNQQFKSTLYLLKHKKESIIKMDPIQLVIDSGNCLELLNIIINEYVTDNQLEITSSIIEYTILNSTTEILQQLLKSTTTDISTIKNKSIKLASENPNQDNKIAMINFILENENLYSLPSTSSSSPYGFIELNNFLSIYNDETKNKLIKFGMVKRSDKLDFLEMVSYQLEIEQMESIEKLVTLVNEHLHFTRTNHDLSTFSSKFDQIMNQTNSTDSIKIKSILKLIIIKYKPIQLYQQYIIKYQKSIDEYHNDKFKTNPNDNGNTLDIYRFLKLREDQPLSNLFQLLPSIDKCIEIPNILNQFNYQGTIITIDNQQTIDWIISNVGNEFSNNIIGSTDIKIQFSTMELTNYSLNKQEFSNLLAPKSLVKKIENFYLIHYHKSISTCNISNLKYIDNINQNNEKLHLSKDKFELPTTGSSKDEILSLFEYFQDSNFKSLTQDSISLLYSKLFNHPTINFSPMDFNINLSTIGDFNSQLYDSIYKNDFKLIQFYLNNINEIIINDYGYYLLIEPKKQLFDSNLEIYHYKNGLKADQVISIINILVSKSSSTVVPLINYFFQLLIQIQGISMETIKSTFQLLKKHSISVHYNSVYHSFYYLNSKSPKFIKYILSRPGIIDYLDNNDYFYLINPNTTVATTINTNSNSTSSTTIGFDLKRYLNPRIFNLYTIFTTNFDTLLNMLIDQLSFENIDKSNGDHIVDNFYNNSLNLDLVYLLDIKRFDLFFKQLEKYKSTITTFELLPTTIQTTTTMLTEQQDDQLLLNFKNKYC